MATFDISVWDCGENHHLIHAAPGWTVAELKDELASVIGCLQEDQHIYLAGDKKELDDTQNVERHELYQIWKRRGLPEGEISLTRRSHRQHKWYKKVQKNPMSFNYTAPEEVRKDFDLLKIALSANGMALELVEEPMRIERDLALIAVQQDGEALQFAKERYRDEPEFVVEAVKCKGSALAYCSYRLRSDYQIVEIAVRQDGWALHWAHEDLQADSDIVLVAVSQAGRALCYAAEDLRDNREICLAAVNQDGFALEYVSDRLKADGNVVLQAVRQNGESLKHADESLRTHRTLLHVATVPKYFGTHHGPLLHNPKRATKTLVTATWEELLEMHKDAPDIDLTTRPKSEKLPYELQIMPM